MSKRRREKKKKHQKPVVDDRLEYIASVIEADEVTGRELARLNYEETVKKELKKEEKKREG